MLDVTKEGLVLLIIIIACWFVAQIIKLFFTKKFNLKDFLIGTGGMPSSHSAAVVALPTFIFLNWGINTLFVVALSLAVVTLRDAFGVRFAVGKNAEILERTVPKKYKEEVVFSIGHTPKQVIAGALVGILVTIIFYIWLL